MPGSWADAAAAGADVILAMPCAFPLVRAAEEAARVAERFPRARVVAVDANRYVSRSGPTLASAVELVARLLHPGSWPASPGGPAGRSCRNPDTSRAVGAESALVR